MSTDVHAYRDAIADDCIIGTCSMNNCLYPDCSVSAPTEQRDLTTMTDDELNEYETGLDIAVESGENALEEWERVIAEQERRKGVKTT